MAIFPGGTDSLTGALMKIYDGPGMIADRADAALFRSGSMGCSFTRRHGCREVAVAVVSRGELDSIAADAARGPRRVDGPGSQGGSGSGDAGYHDQCGVRLAAV